MALELLHRGKVRDVYRDGPDELVLVATDRVSVYDVVLPTPVPDKGKILTQLSRWWFEQLAEVVENHIVSYDDVPAEHAGRAVRAKRVDIVPVECIARGYLAGLGWESYQETGTISGVALPPGLVEADRISEPVFTPTSKVAPEDGHDEPITFEEMSDQIGAETAERLRDLTLTLYKRAAAIAEKAGVILVDTKFEFGLDADGRIVLADEVLTSDSSRYWRIEDWKPGGPQKSLDKQFVRDWSKTLTDWDRTAPGPEIPGDVVAETKSRYVALYESITGQPWH